MSTRITVTSGSDALLASAKQVQEANRAAQLQRERDARTTATATDEVQAATLQPPVGGNPDTSVDRRPAAQRKDLGSTMGVQYTTQVVSGQFRLTVGVPGLAQKVVVETPEPSGAAATNRPPTSSTASGAESVLGFVTTTATSYISQYPCGYTFQSGDGTPPTTSWTESIISRVTTENSDDSSYYLLPIGKKACIFVYVYSKLRLLTVYRRVSRVDRTSTNARPTSSGCSGLAGTYYDRETIFDVSETVYDTEQRQSYKIFAFYVNPDNARELTVPAQLDAAIRALHPPLAVNSTKPVLTSSNYTRYEFAEVAGVTDEPLNYDGPVTYGTIDVPFCDINVHAQSKLHGNYPSRNDVLAKQFGLGTLNEDTHDGDYFTPAVYRFLGPAMNLDPSTAQTYAWMRENYFANAPRKYLAPCVNSSSCVEQETVGFDVSTTAPEDIDTPVLASSFRNDIRYDVELNGVYDSQVIYGWDWDDPALCRQKLTALGFSAADLKP